MMRLIIFAVLFAGYCVSLGCATASPKGAANMEQAAAKSSPLEGRSAPVFSLADQDDQARTLSDYRGKWLVLYFYPKNDTPGCVCEATEFTLLLRKLNELNADVVGVSSDTTASHRFFRAKYDLKFTLLSDPEMKAMRRYGAWVDTPDVAPGSGRVIRSTVLIDPKGRVVHHWPEVIPQGHAERVTQVLMEKQASAAK